MAFSLKQQTSADDSELEVLPPESGPSSSSIDSDLTSSARFKASLSHFIKTQPVGVASLAFIILLVLAAIFADLISVHDPTFQNRSDFKQAPNGTYWLGTDHLGRDIFARLVRGTRISLAVAFSMVFISGALGMLIGGISGFFGGKVDMILQRIVDAIMSIPVLILALFIVALIGPSLRNLILALVVVYTPRFTRIARGEMLRIRESDYVAAAEALGSSPMRSILRHGIPNLMAPIIIMASLSFGNAIIAEAALSFLGLGIPPPNPSWGRMVSDAREWIRLFPWMLLAPAVAISLSVLAFNLFGDALRDHLDPKLVR